MNTHLYIKETLQIDRNLLVKLIMIHEKETQIDKRRNGLYLRQDTWNKKMHRKDYESWKILKNILAKNIFSVVAYDSLTGPLGINATGKKN